MASDAEEAVSAVDDTFGRFDGYRVLHAKGVFCRGNFVATPEAARLTRAPHMQGATIPVTVRFSNGLSDPKTPDRDRDRRGMAVKFHLPEGGITDLVFINLPCFYVRTPEDFFAITRASKIQAFGQPGPRFALYMARHPEAFRATLASVRANPPASYATQKYNSVHSFRWIAPDGKKRWIRYSWLPAAGEQTLSGGEAKKRSRDYLSEEIPQRLAREPIRFTLEVQVARPGDAINDATAVWPTDRERIEVGTLEITESMDDPEVDGKLMVFDPTNIVDGIELSDDPLLALRRDAYTLSAARRSAARRPAAGKPGAKKKTGSAAKS